MHSYIRFLLFFVFFKKPIKPLKQHILLYCLEIIMSVTIRLIQGMEYFPRIVL